MHLSILAALLSVNVGCKQTYIRAVARIKTIDCSTLTPFGGGSGTPANPYLICSVDQLKRIGTAPYQTLSFKLQRDLDLGGVSSQWTSLSGFSGTLDGNQYQISNLDSSTSLTGGLFNSTSGTISNLTIKNFVVKRNANKIGALANEFTGTANSISAANITIQSTYAYIGGIFGSASSATLNDISITDSTLETTTDSSGVFPQAYLGGIVGSSDYSTLSSVSVSGTTTVTGLFSTGGGTIANMVGGMIGYADHLTVSDSSVHATIVGHNAIGGFAARFYDSTLTNSSTSGTLNADSWGSGVAGQALRSTFDHVSSSMNLIGGATAQYFGGIAGLSTNSNYTYCSSSGDVSAQTYGGGLIGSFVGNGTNTITYSHSSSHVVVTSTYAGGLIGSLTTGDVSNSYSTGRVDGSTTVGGLIGAATTLSMQKVFSSSYVTGATTIGGLVGNATNSAIREAHATGAVESTSNIGGGLIGLLKNSTLAAAFATGIVTGDNRTGGIIGRAETAAAETNDVSGVYSSSVLGTWGGATAGVDDAIGQKNDAGTATYKGVYSLFNVGTTTGTSILNFTDLQTQATYTSGAAIDNFDFAGNSWYMSTGGLPYHTPVPAWICITTLPTGITCI